MSSRPVKQFARFGRWLRRIVEDDTKISPLVRTAAEHRAATKGVGSKYDMNMPTRPEEHTYDITYYTRDTRRNKPAMKVAFQHGKPVPKYLAVENKIRERREAAKDLMSRKVPATEFYDPDGHRNTVTTSNKTMAARLAEVQPTHFPIPLWQRTYSEAELLEHNKARGIMVPIGRPPVVAYETEEDEAVHTQRMWTSD